MINIHWFRRDLRLDDNHALYQAQQDGQAVLPIFIFDKHILEKLENRDDTRVGFIHNKIKQLKSTFKQMGSDMKVYYGYPEEIWEHLLATYDIAGVYTNEDYEPYAINRDQKIKALCEQRGIGFHSFKDQVLLDFREVLKKDQNPYTVYTPYSKRWREVLGNSSINSFESEEHLAHRVLKTEANDMPSLKEMGFEPSSVQIPDSSIDSSILAAYGKQRDYPAVSGTSRLGIHLRFGTLSIRKALSQAQEYSDKWLSELIWREFYMSILAHFPHVTERSFRPEYDRIEWLNRSKDFDRWKEGQTGYPIVDAGMRELMATGFMHNRVRMITASFLTKHLLIDWRWGEAWFAALLLDFELASNNGGWQWAAGSGVDAAPYFRIFNPYRQTEKFDPQSAYIQKWVPEWKSNNYPKPIVEHSFARKRCLEVYKKALKPDDSESEQKSLF
jgi:deoxyribodipyrimidine photo-lyase